MPHPPLSVVTDQHAADAPSKATTPVDTVKRPWPSVAENQFTQRYSVHLNASDAAPDGSGRRGAIQANKGRTILAGPLSRAEAENLVAVISRRSLIGRRNRT